MYTQVVKKKHLIKHELILYCLQLNYFNLYCLNCMCIKLQFICLAMNIAYLIDTALQLCIMYLVKIYAPF